METIWRAMSAAGLIGLMLGVAAIEGGAPLLPTFTASLACVGLFALGSELGGLTYKGGRR